MQSFADAFKKRKYNNIDYSLYMEEGIEALDNYRKEFSPGSHEREEIDKILKDILESHNNNNRQEA
jgi:hypothetical protein